MHRVVYNDCFGSFGLSMEAIKRYEELSGRELGPLLDIERHDPFLVQVVEELEDGVDTPVSKLETMTIPGNKYCIEDYDGFEVVRVPSAPQWITIPKADSGRAGLVETGQYVHGFCRSVLIDGDFVDQNLAVHRDGTMMISQPHASHRAVFDGMATVWEWVTMDELPEGRWHFCGTYKVPNAMLGLINEA